MAKRRNLIPTKLETIPENKKSFPEIIGTARRLRIEDVFLKTWHPYVWIASLGFLLYFQAILFDFTYFDDSNLILGNYYFSRDLLNIFEAFKPGIFTSEYYRPLLIVSFMLDAQISGLAPWMYHLSNIIIHIIASSLLFVLLARLKYSKKISLFFSLVFTVHPVLTQAVCWIPGRNDSLMAVFILASFIFLLSFIEKKKWRYYGLHILFSALALFTKESGLVIIAMALVYLLIIAREKILSSNMMVLVFGWAMVITCWLLAWESAFDNPITLTISDMFNAICKDLPATFIFLGKILFPVNLSVVPILRDSTFVFGYLTLIVVVIALVLTRKIRFNFVIFGALWFMLFLIPTFVTSKIFLIAYFMEPRIYLPLIGFIIILLETGLIKKMESKKGYLLPIGAIVVIGLSILTFSHSQVFKDRLRCWENAVDTSPHLWSAHMALGGVFYDEGLRLQDLGNQKYQQALRDNPAAQRNLNSEYYLEAMRLINKAETEFRKAVELHPAEKTARNNIGLIYKFKKMYQEAEEEFRKALEIDPAYDVAFYNLGLVYADWGKYKEAIESYKQAIKVKPDYVEAYCNLGVAYGKSGMHQEAIESCERAIKVKPDYAEAYYGLGNAYGNLGMYQKAIESFKRAISIKPDYADAYCNLGVAYMVIGNRILAIEQYGILKKLDAEKAEKIYEIINSK